MDVFFSDSMSIFVLEFQKQRDHQNLFHFALGKSLSKRRLEKRGQFISFLRREKNKIEFQKYEEGSNQKNDHADSVWRKSINYEGWIDIDDQSCS